MADAKRVGVCGVCYRRDYVSRVEDRVCLFVDACGECAQKVQRNPQTDPQITLMQRFKMLNILPRPRCFHE